MGSTRRAFTDEYKAHAVELVVNDGRTIADVARGIEVHEMTLRKWVKKSKDAGQVQDHPLDGNERAELERLREDNKRLRMEVEFSRKSRDLVCEKRAVIFAAIADWVDTNSYPVNFMCEQLGVSTSGYYKWRS